MMETVASGPSPGLIAISFSRGVRYDTHYI
jgi:hypothetical protein